MTSATTHTFATTWNPWHGPEHRHTSGLTAVLGDGGCGKTTLGAHLAASSLRADDDARWVLLDPPGAMPTPQCSPRLAPHTQMIDPVNVAPGMLNPYGLIPDPNPAERADHPDPETRLEHERGAAEALRRDLCQHALTMLLPQNIADQHDTGLVLRDAIDNVPATSEASPADVLAALAADQSTHARVIASYLTEKPALPSALIPEPGHDPHTIVDGTAACIVLALPRLALPPSYTDRQRWSIKYAYGAMCFTLTAWLAYRLTQTQPGHARTGLWLDDGGLLAATPFGQELLTRIARGSQHRATRTLLSFLKPGELHALPAFAETMDSAFVGTLRYLSDAAPAARLLGLPTGAGHEERITRLSQGPSGWCTAGIFAPREFLFTDETGQASAVTVDTGRAGLTPIPLATGSDCKGVSA
jgi:hypothetical protein